MGLERIDYSGKYWLTLCVLLAVLIIGCSSEKQIDTKFIEEYNLKLSNVNNLLKEHDKIINDINSNINNVQINQQKMREYLDWLNKNRQIVSDFKFFVEQNYQKIKDAGQNPDYVRDNVKGALNLMQQNELKFREALAIR